MVNRRDVTLIKQVLTQELNGVKEKPKIAVRRCGIGNNLHVYVLSSSFARWSLTKRHEWVEALLQRELPDEILLRISALFVLTPKEADGFFPSASQRKENE